MKKTILIVLLLLMTVTVSASYVRFYRPDWIGVSFLNDSDLCFADGTCVSDVTGNLTDTNANTICSGTDVYLDGEGNCDTISGSTVNPNEWDIVNQSMLDNGTIIRKWNTTWINDNWNNNYGYYNDEGNLTNLLDDNYLGISTTYVGNNESISITESQISDLSHTVDTFNMSDEILAVFDDSTNISLVGNTFTFTMTCEEITGSSALCDGDDSTGAGADYTKIQNQSTHQCDTGDYAFGRWANGTFMCRADQSGGSINPNEWDIVNQTILQNNTIIRRWNTSWINNNWYNNYGYYNTEGNLTNLLDDNYLSLSTVYVGNNESISITQSQISDYSPTNLSEGNVEAFIYDDDNTANLNISGYDIEDVGTITINGNNVTIQTRVITWHLDYNGSGIIWWE